MSDFVKADEGKIMPSLIEPQFTKGIAKVLTLGAVKYAKDNWKSCDDRQRYEDALLRHILDYLQGKKCDNESGVSHLYHVSCNLMFLDYMDRSGK